MANKATTNEETKNLTVNVSKATHANGKLVAAAFGMTWDQFVEAAMADYSERIGGGVIRAAQKATGAK
jgi:hypothetical protein